MKGRSLWEQAVSGIPVVGRLKLRRWTGVDQPTNQVCAENNRYYLARLPVAHSGQSGVPRVRGRLLFP